MASVEMKMFLTRIGFGSKVVVTGDTTQVDVPDGRSGLPGWSAPDGDRRPRLRPPRRRRRRPPPIVADIVAAYERADEADPDRRVAAHARDDAVRSSLAATARTGARTRGRPPTWLTDRDRPRQEPGATAAGRPRCVLRRRAGRRSGRPRPLAGAGPRVRAGGVRGRAELSLSSSARPRSPS